MTQDTKKTCERKKYFVFAGILGFAFIIVLVILNNFIFIHSGWLYFVNKQGYGLRVTFFQKQNINLEIPTWGEHDAPQKDPDIYQNQPAYTLQKLEVGNEMNHLYFAYVSGLNIDNENMDGIEMFTSFDKDTFQKEWQLKFPSEPTYLIQKPFLYLTGCALTAKFNMDTGTYVWKQDYDYQSNIEPCFIKIKTQGSKVIISTDPAETDSPLSSKIFDDATGTVIENKS